MCEYVLSEASMIMACQDVAMQVQEHNEAMMARVFEKEVDMQVNETQGAG